LRHLFARQLSLLGSYMGTFADLRAVAALFFDGRIAPVIDSVVPLAHAADAQRRLEDRQQFGKIVLEISSPARESRPQGQQRSQRARPSVSALLSEPPARP